VQRVRQPQKQKPLKITNAMYDHAFDDLAFLLFQQYRKKKQAQQVNNWLNEN
jgi:hypothetical protein